MYAHARCTGRYKQNTNLVCWQTKMFSKSCMEIWYTSFYVIKMQTHLSKIHSLKGHIIVHSSRYHPTSGRRLSFGHRGTITSATHKHREGLAPRWLAQSRNPVRRLSGRHRGGARGKREKRKKEKEAGTMNECSRRIGKEFSDLEWVERKEENTFSKFTHGNSLRLCNVSKWNKLDEASNLWYFNTRVIYSQLTN